MRRRTEQIMKMPNVIRKNKSLAIVVLVTFLAALYLIFECLMVHSKIQDGMTAIERADREIQNINRRKNPNPVKRSSIIINKNSAELRKKIEELYSRFGNPYRANLAAFLKDLNTKSGNVELSFTEEKLIKLFRETWEEYYRENNRETDPNDKRALVSERDQIFANFVKAVTTPDVQIPFKDDKEKEAWTKTAEKVFNNALARFRADLQKSSLEGAKISEDDAKHILMQSFGLPRTMTSQQCKVFIDDIQLYLSRNPQRIPGLKYTTDNNGKKIAATRSQINARIAEFTYNHRNTLPPPGNVENILNHYLIVEDLFNRMNKSDIQTLLYLGSPFSAKPSGSPAGDIIRYTDSEQDMDSTFKKYVYEIRVKSSVDQVRNFVNELHTAYKENRVYEIEEMSFHRDPTVNDIKAINDKIVAARQEREKNAEKSSDDKNGEENSNIRRKRTFTQIERDLIYSDDDYGKPVIGSAKGKSEIIAYIKVNYIVYTGNIIEKK